MRVNIHSPADLGVLIRALRNPEVGDHVATGGRVDQQVFGLDVSVADLHLLEVLQHTDDLLENAAGLRFADRLGAVD